MTLYGICYTWGMELNHIKESKNQESIDTWGLLKSNCKEIIDLALGGQDGTLEREYKIGRWRQEERIAWIWIKVRMNLMGHFK